MHTLGELRQQIDKLDNDIKKLLDKRFAISVEVGKLKSGTDAPVFDPIREEQILHDITSDKELGFGGQIAQVYRQIMQSSREIQQIVMQNKDKDSIK